MNRSRSTVAAVITAGLLPIAACSDTDNGLDQAPTATCEERSFEARLTPDADTTYRVVGELCAPPAGVKGRTLQLMLSGAGYGPAYWDFPFEPERYSYVQRALEQGYATLNLSRIGITPSDRPPATEVDIDANAHVVHEVIRALRSGADEIGPIVTVGHSVGSVTALAHAARFPGEADGVILTGFAHATNMTMIGMLASGTTDAVNDPKFASESNLDGYLVSEPGIREAVFYNMDNADPRVIEADEAAREMTTVGETSSTRQYYGNQSLAIGVPVLIVIGDRDGLACGTELDCTDVQAVIDNETPFFSPQACLEVHVAPDTGHNINLHINAMDAYDTMLAWTDRRLGRGDVEPSGACVLQGDAPPLPTLEETLEQTEAPSDVEATGGEVLTCRFKLTVTDPPADGCIDYRVSDGWDADAALADCEGQFLSADHGLGGATCASTEPDSRCLIVTGDGLLQFGYDIMQSICEGVVGGTYEERPADGWPAY